MKGWNEGYVTDINYTFGYYAELNPQRIPLIFLNSGLAYPKVKTACELGFGQGLSINMHAAASVTQWVGTDFNPAQVSFANQIAEESGRDIRLYDDSFAEFCERTDLPDFDYIGLHGIMTWISAENRALIARFIQQKLKVGGVLYISYNTLPGWSSAAPLRHLLKSYNEAMVGSNIDMSEKVSAALGFADKLFSTNPLYSRCNPQVAERLKKIWDQDKNYVTHEYLNDHWDLMYFSDMAELLSTAKLEFVSSAHFLDHVDAMNLTKEQQDLLKEITDPIFYESVRDFMVNQQFRRDYWVKGRRKLSANEQVDLLRKQRVILTRHPEKIEMKVSGVLGEAELTEHIYQPIIEYLSDYKIRTLGQIEQFVRPKGISFSQLVQAVMVLAGAGHLAPVQEETEIDKSKRVTDRVNLSMMNRSLASKAVNYLASPVTGGGVDVHRFQQLFLYAKVHQKLAQPHEWAKYVWQLLASQNQKLIKEGVTLETEEENLAELNQRASEFAEFNLPVLKALKVVPK